MDATTTNRITVSSLMGAIAASLVGPFVDGPQSADALRSRIVGLRPAPANLVTALTARLVAEIMAPAFEALSTISVNRIRPVVTRHVSAGRLDVARSLVADEVAVGCLSREITRHQSGDCDVCPDGWRYCETLARMEAREARLLDRISNAGGAL